MDAPKDLPRDFQMPSMEDLMRALENMDTLSEEQKAELRESLKARSDMEKGDFDYGPAVEAAKHVALAPDMMVLFLLLTLVTLVFGNEKKVPLTKAEAMGKLRELFDDVRAEVGDEFIDKIKTMIERKTSLTNYLYIFCFILIVAIFVFFGYKLYKSLAERERRKEEKRRQKQQKKKK